jgi:hypothetical protein
VNASPHPYLFTQFGLDSGALTLLGTVVHQFTEPGEYRGAAGGPGGASTPFYLTVDKSPAVNQVNIDLATLGAPAVAASGCDCETPPTASNRFSLGAHGYAVFHVSGGAGGHYVKIGRAAAAPAAKDFDSTSLKNGDLFAATILRPGRYKVTNAHHKGAKHSDLTVTYPGRGKAAFQPPPTLRVECTAAGFSSPRLELKATQGIVFTCQDPSRIVIELIEALDPPRERRTA